MNTREVAEEYRIAHWAGIMRSRQESGLSVREFCKQERFHENVYYYWQRKLREVACEQMKKMQLPEENRSSAVNGFTQVQLAANVPVLPESISCTALQVEVAGIKITADSAYPMEKLVSLLRELNKP